MEEKAWHEATILIVDDNPTNLDVLSNYLTRFGFQVFAAKSGENALELLQHTIPDLLLLDVVMSGIDGFETCQRLKSNEATKEIPVIFMTALSDTQDKIRGFELGAVDYITKPFQREEVLARVKTHLTIQHLQQSLQHKNTDLEAALARERAMLEELRLSLSLSLPHELRTPLTVILGFASFLTNPNQLPEARQIFEYGTAIYRNGLRLHRLVENALLYANLKLIKYTSRESLLAQHEQPCNINGILKNAAQERAKETNRSDDLILSISDAFAKISPTNFEKIVTELIDNAFKFSRRGTPVTIRLSVSGATCVMTITDQGRGMTPEQIAHIGAYMQFGRKQQEQQGSGLGLIIAHLLTELEGGTFRIESQVDVGTTATLQFETETVSDTLNVNEPTFWFARDNEDAIQRIMQDMRVKERSAANVSSGFMALAFTPIWKNCAMLERCFAPLGGEVIEAFNTGDGVRKTLKYHPDLILVDVTLFGSESVELIRQIQRAASPKTVKIFAIASQDANTPQQQQFIQHCDAAFSTPIDLWLLNETVCQHLQIALAQ